MADNNGSDVRQGSKESESVASTMLGALLAVLPPGAKEEFERKQWATRDTDVNHDGTKIILPAHPSPMSLEAAIETLERKLKDEKQLLDVTEVIPGYPFEAAVAFLKAMQELYGWASPVPTPGFWGPKNPDLLTIRIGPDIDDTMQVPIGSFRIPNIEKNITTAITGDPRTGEPVFLIIGNVRKREHKVIRELVSVAKKIMAKESIYRGKALRIPVDDDGSLMRGEQPDFLHTNHVRPEELILSDLVQQQLDTSLFTLVRHTAACRQHKIPLKRGILLEGKYGVGKSLTASVASRVCVENGWTFILLDKVQGLADALQFAKAYQPALVFAEDIDRSTEERDEDTNDLLNTIDGVVNKDSEVVVVLSTNHVERINQAMLRPGRLDAVISVLPPDAKAVERLIKLYGRGVVGEDETLDRIGKALEGQIPATIREVCERSKLAMINGQRSRVIEDDLLIAAEGMKRHLELLNRPVEREESPGEKIGNALSEIVGGVGNDPKLAQKIDNINSNASAAHQHVRAIRSEMDSVVAKSNGPLTTIAKDLSAVQRDVGRVLKAVTN